MYDTFTVSPRPLVPESHRHVVFNALHILSHPGVTASEKLISARGFWSNMRRQITEWARACLQFQHSKIHRHVRSPLSLFSASRHPRPTYTY